MPPDYLVLIIDTTTANNLCDQVAVVGMTPYYYTHLKGNYLQRINRPSRSHRSANS